MGGYEMDADTRALKTAAPPYQRMLSLKTVLAQRLQANQPIDTAALLKEAGWQIGVQQSKASMPHVAVGVKGLNHNPDSQSTATYSQAKIDRVLRRSHVTPGNLSALADSLSKHSVEQWQAALRPDGSVQVLSRQGHALTPVHTASAVQQKANSLSTQHIAAANPQCPEMLAIKTSMPVTTALPMHQDPLRCSELLPHSFVSPRLSSPKVHPYFQVVNPS